MKKMIIAFVLGMLLMLPAFAFAKQLISDGELDSVTAHEGVSITFLNVYVGNTTTLSSAAWGDSDGFTGYTTAGYVGANNVTITGNLTTISGTANIDIGTNGTSTRINLLLPTITLGTMNASATLKLSTASTMTGTQELGSLHLNGFSTQAGGTVQVYAH